MEKKKPSKYAMYVWSAEKYDRRFSLTKEQFKFLAKSACGSCGLTPALDIEMKDKEQGYVESNCVPCCSTCKTVRRSLTPAGFQLWLDRVYAFRQKGLGNENHTGV